MGIQRVQSGTFTIAAGAATPSSAAALPIPVPAAQSLILLQYRGAGNAEPQFDILRRLLTIDGSGNLTHLSAERTTGTGGAEIICRYWISTHAASDLVVQHGTATLPNSTSHDIPITAVVLARAFGWLDHRNFGGNLNSDDVIALTFAHTTAIRVLTSGASAAPIAYLIAEAGVAFASVQPFSVTLGSSDLSAPAGISTVPVGASLPRLSHISPDGTVANIGQKLPTVRLSSDGTQVIVERGASGVAIVVYGFVITWIDGTTVQHGETTIASGTSSGTASWALAISQGQTLIDIRGWRGTCGRTAYASDDNPMVASVEAAFASDTEATLTRGNTAAAATIPWSVVQFAARASVADGGVASESISAVARASLSEAAAASESISAAARASLSEAAAASESISAVWRVSLAESASVLDGVNIPSAARPGRATLSLATPRATVTL